MDNVVPLRRAPKRTMPARPRPEPTTPEPLWREAVGTQLRAERRTRGERIADVAGRAGVSPQYLSEIERGRKDPSSEVLSALAGALGLSVLDLTERSVRHLVRIPARPQGPVALAA
jgi:ribosome-binding protein aMBF1 (putative translation factor)